MTKDIIQAASEALQIQDPEYVGLVAHISDLWDDAKAKAAIAVNTEHNGSMNNDTSNIIVLSPSYHRIIHKAEPVFNRPSLSFQFPNGLVEKVKIDKHLAI